MRYQRLYRHTGAINRFKKALRLWGYKLLDPCAYEILRVEKDGEVYMIYEGRKGQAWHPHLAEKFLQLENV